MFSQILKVLYYKALISLNLKVKNFYLSSISIKRMLISVYLVHHFQMNFNLKYHLLLILKRWTSRETLKGIKITFLTLIIQWIQLILLYPIVKGISHRVNYSLVSIKKQLKLQDQRNLVAIINHLKISKVIIYKGFLKITKVKNNISKNSLSMEVTFKGSK